MPDRAWGYRGGMGESRSPAVPLLEPVLGGVWWTVGAVALPAGFGTVVLAAGLGLTGGLVVGIRRRHREGGPLAPGARTRLIRIVATAVVLVAIVSSLLPFLGLAELSVPLACAITGGALFPAASVLGVRGYLLVGGALLVLAAVGALLALDSAGPLYPQGVVGMVAGAVVWLVGAHRAGLLREVRALR
jgi:hypothetical protein